MAQKGRIKMMFYIDQELADWLDNYVKEQGKGKKVYELNKSLLVRQALQYYKDQALNK